MLTPDEWPIAAGLIQFPAVGYRGELAQEATGERWYLDMRRVSRAGFAIAELADTWIRLADLAPARRAELVDAAHQAGVSFPSVALIRRSVIDPVDGDANLAYSHATIDAAAEIGASIVSVGLHRPLSAEQQSRLWFWTEPGPRDDPADDEAWRRAVVRLRELGEHAASLGLALTLEMYEDTFLGTAESAVRLVEEIGLDTVGINPDFGNLIRLHRRIEDWRAIVVATAPYVNYWHIKSYLRDEDRDGRVVTIPAPLEIGFVDYRWAVEVVVEHGFQGILVCEHYGGDGLSVSARNRDYLRSILPERDVPAYIPSRTNKETA